MRIGLAGTGRIGAFHAATLASLDAVDEVVVTDADPAMAEKVATELGLSVAPTSRPSSPSASTASSSPPRLRATPRCFGRASRPGSPRSARSRWLRRWPRPST